MFENLGDEHALFVASVLWQDRKDVDQSVKLLHRVVRQIVESEQQPLIAVVSVDPRLHHERPLLGAEMDRDLDLVSQVEQRVGVDAHSAHGDISAEQNPGRLIRHGHEVPAESPSRTATPLFPCFPGDFLERFGSARFDARVSHHRRRSEGHRQIGFGRGRGGDAGGDLHRRFCLGRLLSLGGGGDGRLDFTYIKDLTDGMCRALALHEGPGSSETYNLTFGNARTIAELAAVVKEVVSDAVLEDRPRAVDKPIRGTLDTTRARTQLGFVPKWTLEEGYRQYCEWYVEQWQWAKTAVQRNEAA